MRPYENRGASNLRRRKGCWRAGTPTDRSSFRVDEMGCSPQDGSRNPFIPVQMGKSAITLLEIELPKLHLQVCL